MNNTLLSLESATLLSITLIPIAILIIFTICILCYHHITSPLDEAEQNAYLNSMPHSQYQNPQIREASYIHRVPSRTVSEQFLACLQNRQSHQ